MEGHVWRRKDPFLVDLTFDSTMISNASAECAANIIGHYQAMPELLAYPRMKS